MDVARYCFRTSSSRAILGVGAAPPGTHFENLVDVLEVPARPKFINDVVNKLDKLANQVRCWELLLFSKVNELSFKPVANSAPFVLDQQNAWIDSKREIFAKSL